MPSVKLNVAAFFAAFVAFAALGARSADAQEVGENSTESSAATLLPAADAAGTRRALILCGHPGDEQHRLLFGETVNQLRTAFVGNCDFEPAAVWILFGGEDPEPDQPVVEDLHGTSTAESIAATLAELKEQLQPEDTLWVVALGHSHYDGRHSWFNLPGPDLNEQTFGDLFGALQCREQVFWITIPTSGFYIRPLSAENRIVVTATEADREINETIFPHVLAETLASANPDEMDADEDGVLSLLDLYVTLARNVAEQYLSDMQFATEHAQLDANGDGRGTEVQRDYLPEELGGRNKDGVPPRPLPNSDAARAASVPLFLKPPPPPADDATPPMPANGN